MLDDPNDAFWLAQTYFLTHQYSRAERLLTRPFPASSSRTTVPDDPLTNGGFNPFPATSTKGKEKEKEKPHSVHMTAALRLPVGPSEMIDLGAEMQKGISRLVDMSVACRYLAAQCQVRQGKWTEATEMLGEANPFRGSGQSGSAIPNIDGGIKVCLPFLLFTSVKPWFQDRSVHV